MFARHQDMSNFWIQQQQKWSELKMNKFYNTMDIFGTEVSLSQDSSFQTSSEQKQFPLRVESLYGCGVQPASRLKDYSPGRFVCEKCNRSYKFSRGLWQHQKFECGKEPQFQCQYCPMKTKLKYNLNAHIKSVHGPK